MLKKILACCLFAISLTTAIQAQSTMTDEQVLEYVQKGIKNGKDQNALMKELALKGVNRAQAERVKKLYEKKQQEKGDDEDSYNQSNQKRTHSQSKYQNKTKQQSRFSNNNNNNYNNQNEDEFQNDSTMYVEEIPDSMKVFGRDIFQNRNLNFSPSENLATPRNYHLGPGDEVIVDIYGANQTTLRETISPEGSINVDILGPIYLNGMTIEEANKYLKKRLAGIYAGLGSKGSESDITLSLGQVRSIQINVLGDVLNPGTYTLSSFSTVFHALYKAGGIKEPGSLRNIKVARNGKTIAHVDVYDFLMNGNRKGDIRLEEGDVIIVPSYTNLVRAKGKVKREMLFEMKDNESLKNLLNYAGGFAQGAYTKNIAITRQTGKDYEIRTVDSADFPTFGMQNGDIVEVGEVISRFQNRLEIKGAVYRAGVYQLSDKINSVRTLILKAEGLLPEAFTKHAVLHRERQDRSLEVVSVDVEKIMNGTNPDITLRNNDILYIPSIYDLKDQGTLTISGDVASPGIFPYSANTTLEALVLQAGGLLESASVARVDVSRRVKDPTANTASDKIGQMFSFALKDGFVIQGTIGFVLEPYDEVFVRRSPSYTEQQHITVDGEANFTGTYSLTSKNERLSDLVKKAGGVTKFAYVKGARLERMINEAERLRMKDVMKSMTQGTDSINSKQLDFAETYYVGIELDKALANPGSENDVVLREGDRLIIPTYNNTVRISGSVLSPNTVTYLPKMKVRDYIDNAGGYSKKALKRHAYIVHANGLISKAKKRTKVEPGSEIIVPMKDRNPNGLQNILSIATTSASLATMIASIANIIK